MYQPAISRLSCVWFTSDARPVVVDCRVLGFAAEIAVCARARPMHSPEHTAVAVSPLSPFTIIYLDLYYVTLRSCVVTLDHLGETKRTVYYKQVHGGHAETRL